MIFITNNKTTKVLKPCKESFNLPAFLVTPQYPAILCRRFYSIGFMWGDQFNASLLGQPLIQWIAVIRHIADYLFRNIFQKTSVKGIFDKLYFMRARAGCANGDRKTKSVCEAIILVPLPFLVLPTPSPLFWQEQMFHR